jgi:peptidyl-prolyl cis-trans isomerase SurA
MLIGLALVTVVGFGCSRDTGTIGSGPSSGAAARVNGREISRADVDSYFNLRTAGMEVKPTGDAENIFRLEILRQLIETEIMSQKAEELNLKPTEVEIDAQLLNFRGDATEETFLKTLSDRGISEADLRREITQNLMIEKVVQNQVQSRVKVTDEEIAKFYEENKAAFNIAETV